MSQEYFPFVCPTCQAVLNAAHVAASLPDEVLRVEIARRNGKRQTPHAGPGRPTETRCPGCDGTMTIVELRDHRLACVRGRLKRLQEKDFVIHLHPKDPDPYSDFKISSLSEADITFRKLSSNQQLTIELQKIANITPQSIGKIADIQLRGHVVWNDGYQRWDFMSKAAALSRLRRPKRA